jgi:membrane peptidoglycan carboxypeptidase
MNRRTFAFSALTALTGLSCRNTQIEDLTRRSLRRDVFLTLDEVVQDVARRKIVDPLRNEINKKLLPEDTDLAFVCLHNQTGDVLAYFPSLNENSGYDNCRFANRDIASTFKLFGYAIALESGSIRSDETFADEPMTFPSLDGRGGFYRVDNYRDSYSMRLLTIDEAIAKSSNIVATQVYHRVRQNVIRQFLEKLALPTEYDVNRLPIGRYAIPPLVLASRAAVFARGGSFVFPRFISEIRVSDDQQKQEPVKVSQQIFSADVCRTISLAMQRCLSNGTGARAADLAGRVRGKTGSSTDALAIMQSLETTCVLWIGRRNSNVDLKMSGGRIAIPRLAEFYRSLLKEKEELMSVWN